MRQSGLSKSSPRRLALVSMPWVSPHRPSIQLGVLKPAAEAAGFPTTCHYGYLDMCRYVDPATCRDLAEFPFAGDWLFALVYDPARRSEDSYRALRHALGVSRLETIIGSWSAASDLIGRCEQFIDDAAMRVAWGDYAAVGFSMMFVQTMASLCLARRIKERYPHVPIVIGGANADGGQGIALLEAFPELDFCVAGEADESLPRLLRALTDETEEPLDIPGVASRVGMGVCQRYPSQPVSEMDRVAAPVYDEYFETFASLHLASRFTPLLLMETSRGCWYGKCLFCGLNRDAIAFRSKSPDRVVTELRSMVSRYRTLSVCMVDNILDTKYRSTVLPALSGVRSEEAIDVSLFYEIKANVRREEVASLAAAGIRTLQPGIESFVARTLATMRKGSTPFHNLQVLKWCQEYGIGVTYYILHRFPEQTADDVRREADMVELASHLTPPRGVIPVEIERFSPYFAHPEAYGFRNARPHPCYEAVYPPRVDLARVAYSYTHDDARSDQEAKDYADALSTLEARVDQWRASFVPGRLVYHSGGDFVRIQDRRLASSPRSFVLTGVAAEIAIACESSAPLDAVESHLESRGMSVDTRAIEELEAQRLLFVEGRRALFLPVRDTHPRMGTA